jgi:hypothetical protein
MNIKNLKLFFLYGIININNYTINGMQEPVGWRHAANIEVIYNSHPINSNKDQKIKSFDAKYDKENYTYSFRDPDFGGCQMKPLVYKCYSSGMFQLDTKELMENCTKEDKEEIEKQYLEVKKQIGEINKNIYNTFNRISKPDKETKESGIEFEGVDFLFKKQKQFIKKIIKTYFKNNIHNNIKNNQNNYDYWGQEIAKKFFECFSINFKNLDLQNICNKYKNEEGVLFNDGSVYNFIKNWLENLYGVNVDKNLINNIVEFFITVLSKCNRDINFYDNCVEEVMKEQNDNASNLMEKKLYNSIMENFRSEQKKYKIEYSVDIGQFQTFHPALQSIFYFIISLSILRYDVKINVNDSTILGTQRNFDLDKEILKNISYLFLNTLTNENNFFSQITNLFFPVVFNDKEGKYRNINFLITNLKNNKIRISGHLNENIFYFLFMITNLVFIKEEGLLIKKQKYEVIRLAEILYTLIIDNEVKDCLNFKIDKNGNIQLNKEANQVIEKYKVENNKKSIFNKFFNKNNEEKIVNSSSKKEINEIIDASNGFYLEIESIKSKGAKIPSEFEILLAYLEKFPQSLKELNIKNIGDNFNESLIAYNFFQTSLTKQENLKEVYLGNFKHEDMVHLVKNLNKEDIIANIENLTLYFNDINGNIIKSIGDFVINVLIPISLFTVLHKKNSNINIIINTNNLKNFNNDNKYLIREEFKRYEFTTGNLDVNHNKINICLLLKNDNISNTKKSEEITFFKMHDSHNKKTIQGSYNLMIEE